MGGAGAANHANGPPASAQKVTKFNCQTGFSNPTNAIQNAQAHIVIQFGPCIQIGHLARTANQFFRDAAIPCQDASDAGTRLAAILERKEVALAVDIKCVAFNIARQYATPIVAEQKTKLFD